MNELNLGLANVLFESKFKDILKNEKSISVIKKVEDENKRRFLEIKNRDLRLFNKFNSEMEEVKLLDSQIEKLDYLKSPLMERIYSVLHSDLNEYDKQIQIEKIIMRYELDYFKENMDNPSVNNLIIHKLYEKLNKGYDELILEYKLNSYRKLLKDLKKENNKNAIIILMVLYLGKQKCISFTFSRLLHMINTSSDKVNRTNILFDLARSFIKLFKLSKHEKINSKIENILSYDKFIEIIGKLDEEFKFELGDTLLRLILTNCDVFIEEVEIKDKNTTVFIKLNEIFRNQITFSSISLLQLPMVSEPRKIDNKGNYYPYILTDSTNLYINSGNILKGKFDQKFGSEGSLVFYTGVNYLNGIKFKINRKMLSYVIYEWNNKDSKIFKGYNVYKDISVDDNKENKKMKNKHNAKYHLYNNIINIASLYRNTDFYLPVFADFRGRLYPLSNYLNYQGNDLARSLILFSDGERLNEDGKICLNVYLANLAGYDKISWNERINKTTEILLDLRKNHNMDINQYLAVNSTKISEPFQFVSILLTKINLINHENMIVYNPILFDASCSGIQHIAALTLEKELAKNVNVLWKFRTKRWFTSKFLHLCFRFSEKKINKLK